MSKPIDSSKDSIPLNDPQVLSGPFWGELRVFLAVAKAKSFNRAAEALAMSQPTVSRQVRRLQDVMGAQLVVPTQAGIRLTRQGEELANSLLELDQRLFEISNELNAEARTADGLVRLTAGEGLTGLFLAPNLVTFSERYPKIRLQLRTPIDIMNFRENLSDVMLGHLPLDRTGVTSRQLGSMHLLPFVTQAYVERYGVPTRSNLASHNFLHYDGFPPNAGVFEPWHAIMTKGTIAHSCDNSFSYGLMVRSGLGIGLLGSFVLSDPAYIPLDLDVHISGPMYAIAWTERLSSKPVQLVYEWLCEIFSPENPWFNPELKLDRLPRETLSGIAAQLIAGPGQIP